MKIRRVTAAVVVAFMCVMATGCGSKQKEAEQRERERLELEEKARREAEAANKAITDLNQRMFRKKATDEQTSPKADENTVTGPAKEESAPAPKTEAPSNP